MIFQNNEVEEKVNISINGTLIDFINTPFPFEVNSFPKNYLVRTLNTYSEYKDLMRSSDFIIIDKNIKDLFPFELIERQSIFIVESNEKNKNLKTVTNLLNKLIEDQISKGSNVTAIGGGVVQDIAACSCALFRRGQPFVYIPSTTLGQLDSCVGAKCAINTEKAKNILGLFSAPKEVIIPTFMINTMKLAEHRAGLSEMLRLCLTASNHALVKYLEFFDSIKNPNSIDLNIYNKALNLSLSIKKAVVEFDEYEKDIRRSMNYGHTFGHAIEKIINFKIPHGLAVLIGIHMANNYSLKNSLMNLDVFEKIKYAIYKTISGSGLSNNLINNLEPREIINQFKYDKKGDGKSVPLILIEKPGLMKFLRINFDDENTVLQKAIKKSLLEISEWLKN